LIGSGQRLLTNVHRALPQSKRFSPEDAARIAAVRKSAILLPAGLALVAAAAAQPARLDPPAGLGSTAVNLAHSGDTVMLSWLEPSTAATKPSDENASYALRFSRLSAGVWTAPVTVTSGSDILVNWADTPSIVDAGTGTLVAHWAIKTGAMAYDIGLARSEDGGKTWKALGKANDDATKSEHGFVSLLSDRGAVRAFWLDGRESGRDGGAQSLRSAVIGERPGPSERLDGRVCDCCPTASAATAEGPVVVYRDRSDGDVRDIAIVRRTQTGWTKPKLVASDGWHIAGCPVNGPAVDAAGRTVAVAWFTVAGDKPKVKVAFSNDAGASFGRPIVVDAAGPLGRVGVLLDSGDAIVSWGATEGPSPTIRLRRVSISGTLGLPVVIAPATAARTSGFPRLQRAGANLIVAWVEPTEPSRVHAATLPASSVR
jgi:hypothetical protein